MIGCCELRPSSLTPKNLEIHIGARSYNVVDHRSNVCAAYRRSCSSMPRRRRVGSKSAGLMKRKSED